MMIVTKVKIVKRGCVQWHRLIKYVGHKNNKFL